MKNLNKALTVFTAAILLSSCAVTMPYAITTNPIGAKTGVSTTIAIANIYLNNEYGVADAAKNGKIQRIATVDIKTTNYLLFVQKELIVTGE